MQLTSRGQNQMNQKTYFISLGGAGNSILDEILTKTEIVTNKPQQTAYINFSTSDVSEANKTSNLLIVGGDGTGRSKTKGQELIRKHSKEINSFIENFYKKGPERETTPFNVCIISSMGGGTGSSLTPFILDSLSQYDNELMNISLLAVISSPKEGVATLPNSIKSFQDIYNNFLLTNKLKTCFLIDNKKFEKDFNINTFDFDKMNEIIASIVSVIFNEEQFRTSASGHQSLDVNEFRRVLSWGKGLCDISIIDFDSISDTSEFNVDSVMFSGKYKYNTAKAIAVSIMFADKESNILPADISAATSILEQVKKKFPVGFFVFGFSFDNKRTGGQSVPLRFRIFANGVNLPGDVQSNIKKATKDVQKLKTDNEKLEISSDADLDF